MAVLCTGRGKEWPAQPLLGRLPLQLVDLEGAGVVVQRQAGDLLGHGVGDAQPLQHSL